MDGLHPIRLEASLHETIWGGSRLQSKGWKFLPLEEAALGESVHSMRASPATNIPHPDPLPQGEGTSPDAESESDAARAFLTR